MSNIKHNFASWAAKLVGVIFLLKASHASDQWQQCHDKCDSEIKNKELWLGQYLCVAADNYADIEPMSKCLAECLEYKIFKNQTNCWCDYCKLENAHKKFCVEPGENNFIGPDECEKFVCSGLADFYDGYCQSNQEALETSRQRYGENRKALDRKCRQSCNESTLEDMFRGKSLCSFVEINNESIPRYMGKCYWNCMNITVDKDSGQDECACNFCKQTPISHENFCVKPGFRAYIGKNQCDDLACKGKARYHGIYCNPETKEVFAEAQKHFDEDPVGKRVKCLEKCGGERRLLKETWRGTLVCAENEECGMQPTWNTKCFFDCMEIPIAENQKACACGDCKLSPFGHEHYCEKPSVQAILDKDGCEEKVCKGAYKHFGRFCGFETNEEYNKVKKKYGDTEERSRKCYGICGGVNEDDKETYNGKSVCAYGNVDDLKYNETVRISSRRPFMGTKCFLACMDYKIEEGPELNKCATEFCKFEEGEIQGYKQFCLQRGPAASIGKDDCDKLVATGQAKFYGKYCNSTKEELDEAEAKFGDEKKKQITKCMETCGGEDHMEKDAFRGKLVCGYVDYGELYKGPDITSRCLMNCLGFPIEKDMKKCACEVCKRRGFSQKFCLQPGPNASITSTDCDKLVCTGEAKFYGEGCNITVEELAKVKKKFGPKEWKRKNKADCYFLCSLMDKRNWEKDDWHGQNLCYYEDGHAYKPIVASRCDMDCEGNEPAADQNKCFSDFCKLESNHVGFCRQPGVRQSIRKDQCEELVGTGRAKFYDDYCSAKDKLFIDNARSSYGLSSSKPKAKDCWKNCGEKEWYKELYRGEHVCGTYKRGMTNEFSFVEPKCVLNCLGIQENPRQQNCFFGYCKRHPRQFCLQPGMNASITRDDCRTLVYDGNAKRHGVFCDLHSEEELEDAKAEYGS